jgi:hypothetical protein
MSQIYFAISSKIEPYTIVDFCSKKLAIPDSHFLVVEDFIEYCTDNEIKENIYYIQYSRSSGEFDAWVKVYTKNDFYSDIDNCVDFLKELSQKSNERIVTGDEYTDPYSYILIEPTGTISTFDVEYDSFNARDEINLGEFQNHFFGQFALSIKIDKGQLKTDLAELFKNEFSEFELQSGTSGPVVNGDFDKNKSKFKELNNFDYHFDIIPKGKQKWLSIKSKTDIFIDRMKQFSADKSLDICLFPADYSKVENIEGGSDSEEYCIHCASGQSNTIIYKYRRKSWKKSWLQKITGK